MQRSSFPGYFYILVSYCGIRVNQLLYGYALRTVFVIYHWPEQINLKTHFLFMHYIIMFNAFTQFVHHPAPFLLLYHIVY